MERELKRNAAFKKAVEDKIYADGAEERRKEAELAIKQQEANTDAAYKKGTLGINQYKANTDRKNIDLGYAKLSSAEFIATNKLNEEARQFNEDNFSGVNDYSDIKKGDSWNGFKITQHFGQKSVNSGDTGATGGTP